MRSKTDIHTDGFSPDLTSSILKNEVLKTKILLTLFSMILTVQIVAISIFILTHNPILNTIPAKVLIFGPAYIFLGVFCEYLHLRSLKKFILKKTIPKPFLSYLVMFTEISFPGTVMLLVTLIVGSKAMLPISEIINSGPFIIYFVLIILSSLNLDWKLSAFSGLVAALQYVTLCFYLKFHFTLDQLFIPNIVLKGVLIFVCGLAAGFVSEKIKEAIIDSMHAQNQLINELDVLVKEKTKEVVEQKAEIEFQHAELKEKQKEILDSIHYAKRIQISLMPTDKYIDKNIRSLNKFKE